MYLKEPKRPTISDKGW